MSSSKTLSKLNSILKEKKNKEAKPMIDEDEFTPIKELNFHENISKRQKLDEEDKENNIKTNTSSDAAWVDKNDQEFIQEMEKDEKSRRILKSQQKFAEKAKNELFKWAQETEAVEEESKENSLLSLLKTNTKIISNTSISLPQKILNFSRLININEHDIHSSVVNSIEFHPTSNLLLSAGMDKRLKLYNINHTKSVRIQSIFTKDLPIYSASFIQKGKEILLSGSRKYFYYYDLGKNELMKVSHIFGNQDEKDLKKCVSNQMSPYFAFLGRHNPKSVMVMSAQTKQLLFDLKISTGKLQDGCFSSSNYFYAADTSGTIQQFDLRNRKCVVSLADSGSYNTTCISVSSTGKYLATGNYAGIVNIYDLKGMDRLEENQKPMKSFTNLTTSINLVEFNSTDELLAIGSKWKKNGLRLVHLDSLTVYENFPNIKNNVKYPFCCAFSNETYMSTNNDSGITGGNSEFFAVGNDEGHDYNIIQYIF